MTNDELQKLISSAVGNAVGEKFELLIKALAGETSPCPYSLFDWVDKWFKTYKVPKLKDGGYDMANTIRKHLKPNIADKNLAQVSAIDITNALNNISSERMAQITYSIFNQAFKKAVENKLIKNNPMDGVETIAHEYENGRALSVQEMRQFLIAVRRDKQMRLLFEFYLYSGARPSEPLAVKWTDIYSDSLRIRGTKTKLSDREIPLFPELKCLLEKVSKSGEYVFPFKYRTVEKHFDKIRKELPFFQKWKDEYNHVFSLKDLRHTFGTRCAESGVIPKTLQKWLGHSKYETTETFYLHISKEFEKKEIDKFRAVFVKF